MDDLFTERTARKLDDDISERMENAVDFLFDGPGKVPTIGAYHGLSLGTAKALHRRGLISTAGIGDPAVLTVRGRQFAVWRRERYQLKRKNGVTLEK